MYHFPEKLCHVTSLHATKREESISWSNFFAPFTVSYRSRWSCFGWKRGETFFSSASSWPSAPSAPASSTSWRRCWRRSPIDTPCSTSNAFKASPELSSRSRLSSSRKMNFQSGEVNWLNFFFYPCCSFVLSALTAYLPCTCSHLSRMDALTWMCSCYSGPVGRATRHSCLLNIQS